MLREKSLVEPMIKNPFVHHLELTLLDKIKVRNRSNENLQKKRKKN